MAQPDYHLLYVDPTLSSDWFYVAAREYWLKFHPIVIANFDLLAYLPNKATIVVTTLARRDFAAKLSNTLQKKFPYVIHDPLVYDYSAEMKLTLDGRARYFQPYGLPDGAIKRPVLR
jgi:hypothetical protein